MLRYLAATPDQLSTALSHTIYLAHVAYCIGAKNQLLRTQMPAKLHGGLMVISDRDAPPVTQPETLCRQVLQECLTRDFSGIVLDFECAPSPDRIAFLRQLEQAIPSYRRTLYVPESFAACAQSAIILICTALSGGSLRQHLTQAVSRYTPQRVSLDAQRLIMDFPLPAPNGTGTPLSVKELQMRIAGRSSFFSEALCARYFTYQVCNTTHFVLFDDADTLCRKTEMAAQLGIKTSFFMLPEVSDLLDDLYPSKIV